MNQDQLNEYNLSPMTNSDSDDNLGHSTNGSMFGGLDDNIVISNLDDDSTFADDALPLATFSETLDIRDLLSDRMDTESMGGYLQFTSENGVVTLAIDLCGPAGNGDIAHVPLATIEGASGLSVPEIMNALLANHEIRFD